MLTENSLSLLGEVFSAFADLKCNKLENFNNLNCFSLDHLIQTHHERFKDFQNEIESVLDDLLLIKQDIDELNRVASGNLNVFKMFGVGETMHSHILANFLNPNANHGQKYLFLNIFLDLIGIQRFRDDENWIVTAEKGRIDILLKRSNPHSVVVIENKSNYAVDQSHQLYRYWYQEIYKPIKERQLAVDYILNPPSDFYQLIYLSPSYTKVASDNSLRKPSNWSGDLPSLVPLYPKFLFFSDFTVEWLERSLLQIPSENYRLREYILQYLELWK